MTYHTHAYISMCVMIVLNQEKRPIDWNFSIEFSSWWWWEWPIRPITDYETCDCDITQWWWFDDLMIWWYGKVEQTIKWISFFQSKTVFWDEKMNLMIYDSILWWLQWLKCCTSCVQRLLIDSRLILIKKIMP